MRRDPDEWESRDLGRIGGNFGPSDPRACGRSDVAAVATIARHEAQVRRVVRTARSDSALRPSPGRGVAGGWNWAPTPSRSTDTMATLPPVRRAVSFSLLTFALCAGVAIPFQTARASLPTRGGAPKGPKAATPVAEKNGAHSRALLVRA
jgi:hypothetical protein